MFLQCVGIHRCPLQELRRDTWKACNWFRVLGFETTPRQVVGLLNASWWKRLVTYLQGVSVQCFYCIVQVPLDHSVLMEYFHLILQNVSSRAGVVWDIQGVIQTITVWIMKTGSRLCWEKWDMLLQNSRTGLCGAFTWEDDSPLALHSFLNAQISFWL